MSGFASAIGASYSASASTDTLVALGVLSSKGASGQALQNMNLMLGLPEDTGLMQIAMFP